MDMSCMAGRLSQAVYSASCSIITTISVGWFCNRRSHDPLPRVAWPAFSRSCSMWHHACTHVSGRHGGRASAYTWPVSWHLLPETWLAKNAQLKGRHLAVFCTASLANETVSRPRDDLVIVKSQKLPLCHDHLHTKVRRTGFTQGTANYLIHVMNTACPSFAHDVLIYWKSFNISMNSILVTGGAAAAMPIVTVL